MSFMKLRRGTTADLTSQNPVLADGELCYEEDTRRFKIGNGFLAWNVLPYNSPIFDVQGGTSGNTLAWDAVTNKWKSVPGVGALGVWEAKDVTFTYPALQEQTVSVAVPASKPASAQWTKTIQASDLITSNDSSSDPISFSSLGQIFGSVLEPTGVTVGTLNVELLHNGGAVSGNATNDSGHVATDRGNFTMTTPPLSVGDVLELRVWGSATGATMDWVGFAPTISRICKNAPAGGGRWLIRKPAVVTLSTALAPATAVGSGSWANDPVGWRWKQTGDATTYAGNTTASLTESNIQHFADVAYGIMLNAGDYHTSVGTGLSYIEDTSSNQPKIRYGRGPQRITLERLAVPALLS